MSRILSEKERVELNALVDGELDSATATALEQRIGADPLLRAERDAIAASREVLRRLGRPPVSDAYRRRIEATVAGGAAAAKAKTPRSNGSPGWQRMAAAVLVTTLVASSATTLVVGRHSPSLDDLIASGHRRSLLAANPVDVASSDRHTVKPWLDARLGVSPPAPDLAPQGYSLVGGRVEVLGQQPVPALVYRHNEHTITLVAVPSGRGDAKPNAFASGGYNMVRWSGVGFVFRAVSDLEPRELDEFVSDYMAATTTKPAGTP